MDGITNAEKEILLKALKFYGDKIKKLAEQAEKAGLAPTADAIKKAEAQVEALKTKIL